MYRYNKKYFAQLFPNSFVQQKYFAQLFRNPFSLPVVSAIISSVVERRFGDRNVADAAGSIPELAIQSSLCSRQRHFTLISHWDTADYLLW